MSPFSGSASLELMLVLIACVLVLAAQGRPLLLALALAATFAGLGCAAGAARLRAIDAGALAGQPGVTTEIRGFVTSVPRIEGALVSIPVQTSDGRVLVRVPPPAPDVPVGAEIAARGHLGVPESWMQARLEVRGITRVVDAGVLTPTGRSRGGLPGVLDSIRLRAEAALERGMPATEAALARGFVLGQDDLIPGPTKEEFKRSGLSHLLAVSGQNVMLLSTLALAALALLGTSLRARLFWALALIAVYVPVAGGGPSIQRAGTMGAAAIAATLASRPGSRLYILLLAVVATLLLNPRASAEIGWQLSFAAVAGIALWARPLARLVARPQGAGGGPEHLGWRRALAEGFAITTAATLATAPLLAVHFETFSIAALPANLLALPAVAPVMWMGMLTAFAGQVPVSLPVEPLNAVNAALIAFIEQVAEWLSAPGWAQLPASGVDWPLALVIYAVLLSGGALAVRVGRRRAGLGARRPAPGGVRPLLAGCLCAGVVIAVWAGVGNNDVAGGARTDTGALRVSLLDVGQGDAILIEPPAADPILVDGGPSGAGLGAQLSSRGVDRLAAVVATHEQSDHVGGLHEVLGGLPVRSLLVADPAPALESVARSVGALVRRLEEGDRFSIGRLRFDVLWPPALESVATSTGTPPDPNLRSLVLLVRWRTFSMLLTGDAEAESTGFTVPSVDVLKVAHHGSADTGLSGLLSEAAPGLAVISVGEDNPFGHPAPTTIDALGAASVPVLRTDVDGEIEITVDAGAYPAARPER